MEKVLKPPAPKPKKEDASDELSKLFDDGTVLESEKSVPMTLPPPQGGKSPDIKSSPDINSTEPLQNASVDLKSSPDISASPDIKSVRPEQWTAYPNDISDRILRTLELSDQAVLQRLYRLSRGFHRDTCKVTAETLAVACNITSRQVPRSTQRLVARGLIEIIGHDFSNPNKRERGTIYRMLLPGATLDTRSRGDLKARADIKSGDDFKYTIKARLYPF